MLKVHSHFGGVLLVLLAIGTTGLLGTAGCGRDATTDPIGDRGAGEEAATDFVTVQINRAPGLTISWSPADRSGRTSTSATTYSALFPKGTRVAFSAGVRSGRKLVTSLQVLADGATQSARFTLAATGSSHSVRVAGRTAPVSVIVGRWPTVSDGAPSVRMSPVVRLSHHVVDERPAWSWQAVENTAVYHYQSDHKINDDALAVVIHGNSDNHRIQVGEPKVSVNGAGWKIESYMKHDRVGDNPIVKFTILVNQGRVTNITASNVRGASAFAGYAMDLVRRGVNLVGDMLVSWATLGTFTLGGQLWNLLDAVFPEDWLHQYRGWEKDATWYASQLGYHYARALDSQADS